MGGVRRLGRLPLISDLSERTLRQTFDRHFRREDFVL
jgi:hypothetical protein